MFTGIVQAVGVVRSIQPGSMGARLALEAPDLYRPIPPGASICVSGACLTVTRSDESLIEFNVVQETLSKSKLGSLLIGERVNLERSLRVGDPLDGHIVQGHVEGIARVRDIRKDAGEHICTFAADGRLMEFIIPKGSVAIDGVSLTIAAIGEGTLSVALIPTTLSKTTLGELKISDRVNVETDVMVRTIVTTMRRWNTNYTGRALTVEMLQEQGFM